jgi:hypothetical protein
MNCEHLFEHLDDHAVIKCKLCGYAEPDGCFEGLTLHDQISAVEYFKDKDNQET